jgi:mycothione reductase
MKEKEYDIVIIGSGAGASLIEDALSHGKSVALVDRGPAGGTCLNVGCIPTKLIVYPADRIMEIREAGRFGIQAAVSRVDFAAIMDSMRSHVKKSSDRMQKALKESKEIDFYFGEAHFSGDYRLEVNNVTIRGKTIFIASGARPSIPQINGIESIEYLTNESVLQLTQLPESIAIVGGGYIAVEFAHFFEAMGSQVTLIQKNERLVPEEEPAVSEVLRTSLARRMKIHLNAEAIEASSIGSKTTVVAKELTTGKLIEVIVERVLIAAGRRSNADILQVQNTGVKVDERGYIAVDDYFETSRKNIWAFGDAIGKKMFRHAANEEASLVWHNAEHGKKSRMNYLTVPHAVFSWPEIASVGLTQAQAIKLMGAKELLIGTARYTDVARGEAMREEEGFAKAIVHRKTGKIVGYHIVGPQASILIQEVVNAMAGDGNLWSVAKGIHIHPALSELVLKPFAKLKEVE